MTCLGWHGHCNAGEHLEAPTMSSRSASTSREAAWFSRMSCSYCPLHRSSAFRPELWRSGLWQMMRWLRELRSSCAQLREQQQVGGPV